MSDKWTIWHHDHVLETRSLVEILERFATIAGRAHQSGLDEEDLKSKILFHARCLYVHTYKNHRYGNAWRDRVLGHRMLIPLLRTKLKRIIKIAWEEPADLGDRFNRQVKEKIVETTYDLANYAFFFARMLEIEFGVDYSSVRDEALEADYPDFDLECLGTKEK